MTFRGLGRMFSKFMMGASHRDLRYFESRATVEVLIVLIYIQPGYSRFGKPKN